MGRMYVRLQEQLAVGGVAVEHCLQAATEVAVHVERCRERVCASSVGVVDGGHGFWLKHVGEDNRIENDRMLRLRFGDVARRLSEAAEHPGQRRNQASLSKDALKRRVRGDKLGHRLQNQRDRAHVRTH